LKFELGARSYDAFLEVPDCTLIPRPMPSFTVPKANFVLVWKVVTFF